jgi:hypothetical protein
VSSLGGSSSACGSGSSSTERSFVSSSSSSSSSSVDEKQLLDLLVTAVPTPAAVAASAVPAVKLALEKPLLYSSGTRCA